MMRTMEPVPLWGIIFINCMIIWSSIEILIRLYKSRSKRSTSFYIYGIASLIGLFLGVISFFYHICHALCAILWGLYLFIDTYTDQKKHPRSKGTTSYSTILKGYYGGIGFMIYGIMLILLYYNII